MALSQNRFESLKEQLQKKKQGLEHDKFELLRASLRRQKEQKDEITPPTGDRGLKGFATGVAKEELSLLFGAGKLGAKIGRALLPKFAEPKEPTFFEREEPEILEARTPAERAGKFVTGVAEFAVPATKVGKIAKGVNFITRLGARMLTSGGVASIREGEVGREAVIAATTEAAIPIANKAVVKPIFNIVRRLTKGLGSGLSGVSTDAIDTIIRNPGKAQEISRQLEKAGNFKVLDENARTIVNGVSRVRQEARKAFGEGLEQLKIADINPTTFKTSVRGFLTKVGSSIRGGKRTLTNVEFEDPKNIKKASDLIDEFSRTKLDGFSLRKLLNKVSDSKFKTATTDERLSFNAFIGDMEKAVKDAVSGSTKKLDEINRAFSADIQLAEGVERILGKVKFKSLAEIDRVAQKLESLFSQKGLNPRSIDNFLTRIGISPEEFRTREAVRQITSKVTGANIKGLSFAELLQQVTSAVITPETVKNLSILTGLTEQAVKPMFERLAPIARGTLIKLFVDIEE